MIREPNSGTLLDVQKRVARTPTDALTELLAQHGALREMIEQCLTLLTDLDHGRIEAHAVMREVTRLRSALTLHNEYEEQFLRPVLAEGDAFSEVRVERMVEEHKAEHAALGANLSGTPQELRSVLDHLRSHLEAEERYFLSSNVLRNDIVVVEDGG